MPSWHAMKVEDVLRELGTSLQGLPVEEARRRLQVYGPNVIEEEKKVHPLEIFLRQFKSPLILLLIFASILSYAVGEAFDSIVILALVLASAALGFYQEYRAEKALEAIKKMVAPQATVLRGGEKVVVNASEVVPGDVLLLSAGDRVVADARIVESVNLRVNEAPLTGESTPVEKMVDPIPEDTPLPDRANMVYAGTVVVYGRGKAVVVATGKNTELGKISATLEAVEERETPLERELSRLSRWILVFMLVVAVVVSLVGFFVKKYSPIDLLLWIVSLAVAAVPEALPVVVTSSLALGVYRMAKKNAIVRRLPAVETLGSTTYICSDKTGTITKGEMTAVKVWMKDATIEVTGTGYEPTGKLLVGSKEVDPNGYEGLRLLLLAAFNNNDSEVRYQDGRWVTSGDGTEIALKVLALKAGVNAELPRLGEVPFSSERKRMSTLHELGGRRVVFTKGAPEVVVPLCRYISSMDGRVEELSEEAKRLVLAVNDELAGQGLRNIAIAYRYLDDGRSTITESDEKDLVLLGIVSMIDPPRPEVKDALETCKKAGIRVAMITGDHKLTAVAVARELGMLGEDDIVVTGKELDSMSDAELYEKVEKIRVYARVSPEHKLRIVEALKKRGHVVAMTGDGVNDAPALKAADVGVAMGRTGTEVAKEASDLVLADDNFATIVEAVKLGREIFENIKKFLVYLLSANVTELMLPLVSSVLGLPLPFTATQILWVNLVTDGPPAIALSLEKGEKDLIYRNPRKPGEPIFSKKEILLFLVAVPLVFTVLLTYAFSSLLSLGEPEAEARTAIFTSLVVAELAMAYAWRSLRKPSLTLSPLDNKPLVVSIILSVTLQLAFFASPYVMHVLEIHPVTINDIIYAALVTAAMFVSVEAFKYLLSKWK